MLVQYYGSRGIRLIPLPNSPTPYDVPDDVAISHRVYTWLNAQSPFDVVHLSDAKGRGYFTLTARMQGKRAA